MMLGATFGWLSKLECALVLEARRQNMSISLAA